MKKQICENCKYYIGITEEERAKRYSRTKSLSKEVAFWAVAGRCCRFPKREKVILEGYCGEYKQNNICPHCKGNRDTCLCEV